MDMTEKFLSSNDLHDADDMDALLELADLVRQAAADARVFRQTSLPTKTHPRRPALPKAPTAFILPALPSIR